MLDLFGITTSGLMMLFIVFRAFQLDSTREWFERVTRPTTEKASETVAERRRPRR
jgi:hypothetical protein